MIFPLKATKSLFLCHTMYTLHQYTTLIWLRVFLQQIKILHKEKVLHMQKKTPAGHYVVVEAVGGKRNKNIVPVMILEFSEAKWNKMQSKGLTLGEVLYENDEPLRESLDIEFNKKNRVTVAQFASSEAIANTPRSPRISDSISQKDDSVKTPQLHARRCTRCNRAS